MKKIALFTIPLLLLCSCANAEESKSHKKVESIWTSDSSQNNITSEPAQNDSNILVAYFSATETTKPLAEFAANHYECDLFRITPVDEYARADLNYGNQECRALQEQADVSCRPEISNRVEDMSKYSTVILGYPIWAMKAPRIVFTFLESYSFEGKRILPFCTSGSSDISVTLDELHGAVPNATWLPGKRFAAGTDEATFVNWLDTVIQ